MEGGKVTTVEGEKIHENTLRNSISQKRLKAKVLRIDLWHNNSFLSRGRKGIFAGEEDKVEGNKAIIMASIIHVFKHTNFIILSLFLGKFDGVSLSWGIL